MIGRFEVDKIYNEDCYKAIKDIPDKSIDCVYVDIPYLFQDGGAGASEVAQRILKMRTELQANEIYDGCDLSILPEFVRVLKNLNCFIWCSREQVYPNFGDKFVKYEWFKYFLDDALNHIRDEYLREFVKEEILEKYGEEK